MAKKINRRGFLKKTALAASPLTLLSLEEKILLAAQKEKNKPDYAKKQAPAKTFPTGKIGNVNISRVICGGNLISGYSHSRDLIYVSELLRSYFTKEKIFETLQKCEENGINAVVTTVKCEVSDHRTKGLLKKYWNERGGKIQWIAQCCPKVSNIETVIKQAVDSGAVGAYLHGGIADNWTKNKRIDLIAKTVDYIKQCGIIAGVAGHSLNVPIECEKASVNPDFYMKTLHQDDYWSAHPKENREDYQVDHQIFKDHNKYHDNMWCIKPDETAEFMSKVKKPWLAYKVLAAGAIHPKDGFKFAYEKGADFLIVGMFDFHVGVDAYIAKQILAGKLNRTRPWRG